MNGKFTLILAFLLIEISAQQLVNNYICSEEFCEKYLETTGCEELAEPCRVQNATMNGIVLPSQTPCSCCQACLENLNEADDCTIGLIGAPVPSAVCGPDLTCTIGLDEEHAKCQLRTATTCLTNVRAFNEGMTTGTLGHLMLQPECNTLGDFNAFRCIPGQICYCVDKSGERIFGDALYVPGMSILMRCQCSREERNLRSLLNIHSSNSFIRCDEMGSYDRIQCLGDKCICVDQHTGSPTSPAYNRTNLDDLQKDWECFTGRGDEVLVRPCEERRRELAKNTPDYLTSHDLATMCQPDGWFDRVQRNRTHRYCVDEFGSRIGDYGQVVEEGSTINCNCARVVNLLKKDNRIEFPQCCGNGNYKRINCRRGFCYCVDANGQQISAEVPRTDKSLLTCFVDDDALRSESDCN